MSRSRSPFASAHSPHRRTAVLLAGLATAAATLAGAPAASAAPPEVTPGDYYRVTDALTGLAVDVENSSADDGARVVQFPVDIESRSQDWRLLQYSDGWELRNASSGRCLSVALDSREAGANLVQRDCHATPGQLWTLEEGEIDPTGALRSVLNGYYVEVPGGTLAPNTLLELRPGNQPGGAPGANQSFYLVRVDV